MQTIMFSYGLVVALATTIGLPLDAMAQATPDGAIAPAPELPDVIVTARKRAEDLQELDQSVSVLDATLLKSADVHDILQVSRYTPSLVFSEQSGQGQLYIRGVGSDLLGGGADASVTVHVDGIYLGRPEMALGDIFDAQRIEILRGPQGTLYGRNSAGGTINIISNRPTSEFAAGVHVTLADPSNVQLDAFASGPISDRIALRLFARATEADGYTDNLDSRGPSHMDGSDRRSVRGTLQADLSDSFGATLIAEYQSHEDNGRTVRPLDDLGFATLLGALPNAGFHDTRNGTQTFNDKSASAVTAELNWALGSVRLTSLTGYRELDTSTSFNTDGTEIDVTETQLDRSQHQWSQELRLASGVDGDFDWIVGAYYFAEDTVFDASLVRYQPQPPFPGSVLIFSGNDTEAWALFADGSYRLSEYWALNVGTRYSHESKEDRSLGGLRFDTLGILYSDAPIVAQLWNVTRSDDWTALTPRVSLQYTPVDSATLYLSASRGFKSGGTNSVAATPPFDPEYIWSYELGLKSEFADRRTRLNAAVFQYDYTDLQVLTTEGGLASVTNAAEATIRGMELELEAKITDRFKFGIAATLLDAEYDTFLSTRAGLPVDVSGNRMPSAPKLSLNATIFHTVPLASGGTIQTFLAAQHRSETFYSQFEDVLVRENGYTTLDARIAYVSDADHLEIALFGRNISDEQYFQYAQALTTTSPNPLGNALGYPAPPRSFGVEFIYRY